MQPITEAVCNSFTMRTVAVTFCGTHEQCGQSSRLLANIWQHKIGEERFNHL